jgi:hypothetical protein
MPWGSFGGLAPEGRRSQSEDGVRAKERPTDANRKTGPTEAAHSSCFGFLRVACGSNEVGLRQRRTTSVDGGLLRDLRVGALIGGNATFTTTIDFTASDGSVAAGQKIDPRAERLEGQEGRATAAPVEVKPTLIRRGVRSVCTSASRTRARLSDDQGDLFDGLNDERVADAGPLAAARLPSLATKLHPTFR